ncbi:MAG: hypothetical protein GXO23_01495 [Crenarchaeota archaeon]|nr:hypothetical protein [Thermoproteota archaeon]
MKKSVAVAAGIIIAICIIVGGVLAYFYYSHKAPSINMSKSSTGPSINLENILLRNINVSGRTYYTEVPEEEAVLIANISRRGGPARVTVMRIYMQGLKGGEIKNSTSIVYYGYIKNLTTVVRVMSGSISHWARIEMLNLKYLSIMNIKNGYVKYCINGKLILRSDSYNNITALNRCEIIPLHLAKALSYVKSIDMVLARDLMPLLLRGVKYLGEKNINGLKCYMYEINNNIDVTKILVNRTLINDIVNALAKVEPNITEKVNTEKILNITRKIAMMLAMAGLSEWNLHAKFCITGDGIVPYLYAKITNVEKTMFNVTLVIKAYEKGRMIEVGKVNTALLKSIESSISKKVVRPTSPLAYLGYVPEMAPSPVLSVLYAFETSYFFYATATASPPSVKTVPVQENVTYAVFPTSRSLQVKLVNTLHSPIKEITIEIVGIRNKSLNIIRIICPEPLQPNSSINIICVKGIPCKINIRGTGRCAAKGAYNGTKVGKMYLILINVETSNGKIVRGSVVANVTR